MKRCILLLIISVLCADILSAQGEATGKLAGQILDKDTELPLTEASVELLNFSPKKIVLTNEQGVFELNAIPTGRYRVMVTKEGYQGQIFSDLLVSGAQAEAARLELTGLTEKEVAAIEEAKKAPETEQKKEQVLYLKTAKDLPHQQMLPVAVRPFTVEEVTRYAGSRFDLARLTNNFAGVSNNYDARNDIVIRGNSPAYLTWQIEELPVENPNHLSALGTAGGTTTTINIFALGKADFLQGSFAAQYGNSAAGIFDLQLRQGNTQRFSGMGLLSTQRAELLLEGPLGKRGRERGASFLVSGRFSIGTYLYSALTYPIARTQAAYQTIRDWADPAHRDLNFKLNFGKWGKHELEAFGVLGQSYLRIPFWAGALRDKVRYQIFEGEDFYSHSISALVGLKYSFRPNSKFLWRTIVGSTLHSSTHLWDLRYPSADRQRLETMPSYESRNMRRAYMAHSYTQWKPSPSFTFRSGVQATVNDVDLLQYYSLEDITDTRYEGIFALARAYAQIKWQPARRLYLFTGVHAQHYSLTNETVAEPRFGLQWEPHPHHTFAIGSGLHHQTQHFQTQFFLPFVGFDQLGQPMNENLLHLPSNRSIHADAEYRLLINDDWRLRAQVYAQFIDRVAVERDDSSAFSMLNTGESFFDYYYAPLVPNGKGRNMGVELTVEKFFSKNYYALFTATLYDSRALGSDGIWRNTVFNNRYIINLLFGKEWSFGKVSEHTFFADVRFCTRGGRPYTPIDAEATYIQGFQNNGLEEVFIDSLANMVRTPAFYQVDLKVGIRLNDLKNRLTHGIRLDLFNAFNLRNVLTYRYSAVFDPISGQTARGTIEPIYQRGFIPDLTYFIQF